jgi:hypothetical protein
MTRLAKLQFIGPAVLLLAIAAAEGAVLALPHAPASETLWYLNLDVFGAFRRADDALSISADIDHAQLCIVGLPVFLTACWGLIFGRVLPLAVASNLAFLYASCLLYGRYVHGMPRLTSLAAIAAWTNPGVTLSLVVFSCALLSFSVSHIVYIRNIRIELG